jgi:hypothetical protein
MARRLAALIALATMLGLVSCEDGGETLTPEASPTPALTADTSTSPTPPAAIPEIVGFDIRLTPEARIEVTVGALPAIFEDFPGVVEAPLAQTSEGQVSSPSTICSGALPVKDVTGRLLGSWLSYAIQDESGNCVATRQGFPREDPGLPSLLALESALVTWAGTAVISGPTEPFEEEGVTYFPPERVTMRGTEGVYLRETGGPGGTVLPVHQLLWIEDGAYWRLIGLDEGGSGDPTFYNLERLLRVAETLRD